MDNKQEEKDHLTLKWGTLKDWHFHGDHATKLMKEYNAIGSSMSAIMQHDTPRQKEIICELIDQADLKKIFLDWEGKEVSKNAAKKYVMEYGN